MPGALFCSKCGNQLIYPEDTTTNVIKSRTIERIESENIPEFPAPPADASDSKVALLVLDNSVAIHIRGREEFTLGRSTKGQTIIPDIDLNPFNAYEAGVSRLHANLTIAGGNVFIHDLGSANGTHLNGRRIDPHVEQPIQHGDILTFGQLKVQVLIKAE
jgi:pSer/pThr/pTyr-binding forkhead associated (FHA) protein